MEISGSFTLSICDSNVDFKSLEENIGIDPTKIIKKGQLVGRLKNRKAPYDVWLYEIKITNEKDVFDDLAKLLSDLLPYSEYIKKIKNVYSQVTINCYLRSDLAQLGFVITASAIDLLGKFGLDVNFHILSFGCIED